MPRRYIPAIFPALFIASLLSGTALAQPAPASGKDVPLTAAEKTVPAAEKPAAEKPAVAKDAKKEEAVDPLKARDESFARGRRAYDRGDWLKAIFDLRPLAEYGDERAMMLLGNMYASGNGVGKDPKEAFQLYHRAAAQKNNLDGMIAIAAMYQTGLGVGVNTRLAIGWFERAAMLGSQGGAFFYAIHKFQGSKGTTYDFKSDHEAAYKWFRIAATRGDDKKLRRAAYQTSERLAARLTPDRVIEMNKEAADWAPSTLADIGPNPEDTLIKELQAKGQEVTPDKLPEEKPLVTPKPKKKEEGESLVPP